MADLNPKQEEFAKLYASDQEFFGNGVQSYIEAYNPNQSKPNWYKTSCSRASELLSNPKVCARINQLLEEGGLNDQFVDKQLTFLITQHADFGSKMSAIREYNQLKSRITKNIKASVEFPTPILGGASVRTNDSPTEASSPQETD